MSKYIIREQMRPEAPAWWDMETDGLYIMYHDRSTVYSMINDTGFQEIRKEIDAVIDELDAGYSVQEVMQDYNIPYSPENVESVKVLDALGAIFEEERIAKYLQMKTGEPWKTRTVRGYCQGDCAIAIYNAETYNEKDIDIYGDYCFGCFKEFSITDPDGEDVYGYYVTDSELSKYDDQEYKEIVCGMEGINPDDAILEMIEEIKTIRQPVYRTA